MGHRKAVPGWWGPAIIALSAVFFAAAAVLGRLAAFQGLSGFEITFARFFPGLVYVLGMHAAGSVKISLRRPGWLLVRGLSGGLGNLFLFLALSSLADGTPMTNAALLGNSYFVFAPLFGALLIKERLRASVVGAVLIALVGIYLVVDPSFGRVRIGDIYGLAGGIVSGLAIAAVRELRRTETAATVFFALCIVGVCIAGIGMLVCGAVMPDPLGWLLLVGVGITGTIAQYSQTYAFRFVRAGEGGLIAMTTVIYSAGAGILLLGEDFTLSFALGAALVLGSAAYLAVTTSAASEYGGKVAD